MFRRTLLSPTRIRPFSSLTAAAARHPSQSLSLPTSGAAQASSKLLQRTQTPLQWRNATVLSRWSSTESAAQTEATGEASKATDGSATAPTAEEVAKLRQDLETKTKEAADLKDKYLRSVADFRNLQDRTVRETKAAKDFAIQKFAKDLLESIDNLDRALSNTPQKSEDPAKDYKNLYDGLKMTETVLMGTLEKHGLVRFDPLGEKFNPNMHEATFEAPMPGKEAGSVFHVQSKGYSLNNRVLRAAQVGVVRAP